jgi:hypothetical protein
MTECVKLYLLDSIKLMIPSKKLHNNTLTYRNLSIFLPTGQNDGDNKNQTD